MYNVHYGYLVNSVVYHKCCVMLGGYNFLAWYCAVMYRSISQDNTAYCLVILHHAIKNVVILCCVLVKYCLLHHAISYVAKL